MTLSSSESLAAPAALVFERLAITRVWRLVDSTTAMELGLAAGQILGFTAGYPIGLDQCVRDGEAAGRAGAMYDLPIATGYDRGYAAGLEAGRRAALADGMMIGRADGYRAGQVDGLAVGEALGFATGFALAPEAPEDVIEDDEPETFPTPIPVALVVGDVDYVDYVALGLARLPWQFSKLGI